MKSMIALLFFAATLPAAAQELPALYDVSGVAADDVLNIRADPRATASLIGELAPDASGIEVTALSGNRDWGRVNTAERSGWVSMAYLEPEPVRAADGYFDHPLACFGTEPFWSLDNDTSGRVAYTPMDGEPVILTRTATASSANRGGHSQLMEASSETVSATAILRREECSDGMSDKLYGLTLDLVLRGAEESRFVSGCCSIAPR